jgi:hypothetical protein
MRTRRWALFSGWQLAGVLIGLAAHHVDALSWWVSGLMLMPGTLLSLYVFREGDVGNNWGKWAVFGVAAAFNVLAFATVAILRRKRA